MYICAISLSDDRRQMCLARESLTTVPETGDTYRRRRYTIY